MKQLEQIAGVAMLLLAAAVIFETRGLSYWDDITPGPRFMPLWVSGAALLLSGLLLFSTLRQGMVAAADWPDRAGRTRVGLTVLAILGFLLLVPWLGFVLGSAVFVLATLLFVLRRPVLPSLVTAVVSAGIIQIVFVWWLSVALPHGILGL